jgi:ribulose-5-phosphate 4-epimerase/fuculose-1-phosphate aldolase
VAHSHSIYGRTFCSFGRSIDITTQDSCAFYNDHAIYASFGGTVLAKEEGEAIATALGSKKAALLQNHGLLTCGQSIESAVFWFMSLEKCCHTQLMTDAISFNTNYETIKIAHDDAYATFQAIGTEAAGHFSAKPQFDLMAHQSELDYGL